MRVPEIEISAGAYLGLAFGILVFPLDCLLAAIFAAGIHECCHLLALKCCSVPVNQLKIGLLGAKIRTGMLSPVQELLCAAAGPAGSLSLAVFANYMPLISLFGLCQGFFNLVPVYPLDGGRICRSIFMLAKMRH